MPEQKVYFADDPGKVPEDAPPCPSCGLDRGRHQWGCDLYCERLARRLKGTGGALSYLLGVLEHNARVHDETGRADMAEHFRKAGVKLREQFARGGDGGRAQPDDPKPS